MQCSWLQSGEPQNSEIAKVELEWIQKMLGITSGGADALIALSLLCGGDYAIKGAEHVGSRSAIRLVQHLLHDCQVGPLPHHVFSGFSGSSQMHSNCVFHQSCGVILRWCAGLQCANTSFVALRSILQVESTICHGTSC